MKKAEIFLENIGLKGHRYQQKIRHTFRFDQVMVDIDTWPRIPTYVELEGPSEEILKSVAMKIGLDWGDAVTFDAKYVIENVYKIPVGTMKYFRFDRFE
jgi:adenylate cyclase class 2